MRSFIYLKKEKSNQGYVYAEFKYSQPTSVKTMVLYTLDLNITNNGCVK